MKIKKYSLIILVGFVFGVVFFSCNDDMEDIQIEQEPIEEVEQLTRTSGQIVRARRRPIVE
ncbi:MAG: hypothetical protein AAF620_19790 [Bacteroidota bacterium]